jgi:Tol biopolymer transport system component
MKSVFLCASLFALVTATLAAPMERASFITNSSTTAAGNSFAPQFSADGRWLVFLSQANNLVTNDQTGLGLDVFARDLVGSNTVLVSVSSNDVGGANADAVQPSVSSNGQVIAFASRASNLVPGGTTPVSRLFVRDLLDGVTRQPIRTVNHEWPTSDLQNPQLSGNGRWLAFESTARDLAFRPNAPADSLNTPDVFVCDLLAGTNALVSVRADNTDTPETGAAARTPVLSYTGSHIAFISDAPSVIGSDQPPSSKGDVYVRDMSSHQTHWASTNVPALLPEYAPSNYRCLSPVMSDDGRFVAFFAAEAVLRHDVWSNSTVLLWRSATNLQHGLQMSADGARVLFEAQTNGASALLLWDATAGFVTNLTCPGASMMNAALSRDGSSIAYLECGEVVRVNVATRARSVLSLNTNGASSSQPHTLTAVAISPTGSHVAFESAATDLAAHDLNSAIDIFLSEGTGRPELISRAAITNATASAHLHFGRHSVSGDGRFVVFTRYDDPSTFRDTNRWPDVFLSDRAQGQLSSLSLYRDTHFTNIVGGSSPQVWQLDPTNGYFAPIISADGSTVYATRRQDNGRLQVVRTLTSSNALGHGMSLVSRNDVKHGNGDSYAPSTSSNGMLVVFVTHATDLVPGIGDDNRGSDVVLRRYFVETNGLLTATNELISKSWHGDWAASSPSSNAVISLDGRWIVFESRASDILPTPISFPASFARDLWSNTTHMVASVMPGVLPHISPDSRRVIFRSPTSDGYIHDLITKGTVYLDYGAVIRYRRNSVSTSPDGRIAYEYDHSSSPHTQIAIQHMANTSLNLISLSSSGERGDGLSRSPQFAGNGRYVVFQSTASNLVPDDHNNESDIFLRDLLLGQTLVLSVNLQGRTASGASFNPVVSLDGRVVVFQSFAADFGLGDFNSAADLYAVSLGASDTDADGLDDDWEVAFFENLSRDGTGDADQDGQSDRTEFLTGTDPTNADSVLRVISLTGGSGNARRIFWIGNPNRSYRVEYKNTLDAAGWIPLPGTVTWNGSTASMLDENGGATRFYRVVRTP